MPAAPAILSRNPVSYLYDSAADAGSWELAWSSNNGSASTSICPGDPTGVSRVQVDHETGSYGERSSATYPLGNSLAMVCAIRPTGRVNNNGWILAFGNAGSGNAGAHVILNPTSLYVSNQVNKDVTYTGTFALDGTTTYIIGADWDATAGVIRVYVNGTKVATSTTGLATVGDNNKLIWGMGYGLGQAITGKWMHRAVFLSPLGDAGHAAIAAQLLTPPPVDSDPPDEPVVAATRTGSVSVDISWPKPDDNPAVDFSGVSGYLVKLDGVQVADITDPDTLTYTLAGLTPDTDYTIEVAAYDEDENVSTYDALVVHTAALPTPANLRVFGHATSMLLAAWDAVDTDAGLLRYELRVDAGTPISATKRLQKILFGSLAAGTAYDVQVRAVYTEGTSTWSAAAAGTTLAFATYALLAPGGSWDGTLNSGGTPPADADDAGQANAFVDVVPYQRLVKGQGPGDDYPEYLNVSVLAVDESDVPASVDFWFEGGTATVSAITRNCSTGTWGACATLSAAGITVGGRANLYVKVTTSTGKAKRYGPYPFVLEHPSNNVAGFPARAVYYINPDTGNDTSGTGTALAPCKTIVGMLHKIYDAGRSLMSGITIYVQDNNGEPFGLSSTMTGGRFKNNTLWDYMRILPAPGHAPTINASDDDLYGGPLTEIRDFAAVLPVGAVLKKGGNETNNKALWIHECSLTGDGYVDGSNAALGGYAEGYITECDVDLFATSPLLRFCRNLNVGFISGDVANMAPMFNVYICEAKQVGSQHLDFDQIELGLGSPSLKANVICTIHPGDGLRYVGTGYGESGPISPQTYVNTVVYIRSGSEGNQFNFPVAYQRWRHAAFLGNGVGFMHGSSMKAMTITGGNNKGIVKNTTVTGQTSGTTAVVTNGMTTGNSETKTFYAGGFSGAFTVGETVTGLGSTDFVSNNDGTASFVVGSAANYMVDTDTPELDARGCVFVSFEVTDQAYHDARCTFSDNVYQGGSYKPGAAATLASPFVGQLDYDFRPAESMPTMARLAQVPFDIYGRPRGEMTAVGVVAFQSEAVSSAAPTLPTLSLGLGLYNPNNHNDSQETIFMDLLASGTTTIGAAATQLCPSFTGRAKKVWIGAGDSMAAAARIGLAASQQHYLATDDKKGFEISSELPSRLYVSGTEDDVVRWAVYG